MFFYCLPYLENNITISYNHHLQTMSNLRFKVLQEAFAKKAVAVQPPAGMVSDYYGSHIFGRKQMARYLSAETYRAFCDVLDNGAARWPTMWL